MRPYGEIEVSPKHNHIGIHDQLCATAVQQDLEMAARERLAADRGLLGWYFDILGSLGFPIFNHLGLIFAHPEHLPFELTRAS